jgi:uncharacterized metal-binding protein
MFMNTDDSNTAALNKPITVVHACSGYSDAGEIADRVVRRLTRDGMAKKIPSGATLPVTAAENFVELVNQIS